MEGDVCRSKGCHLCCMETEMELTERDVSRLEASGFRDFATKDRKIANSNGRCIFLNSSGLCNVYDLRPEGCRLYPLVMRLPERLPMLDRDCPHRALFSPSAEDMIALEDIVRRLEAGQ